jgi:hypothetical protein
MSLHQILNKILPSFWICVASCVSMPANSQKFKPIDPIEQQFFAAADEKVFPNDVRENLGKYKDNMVAWAGVITDVNYTEPADQPESGFWIIKAKHHYFNWLVAPGPQPERVHRPADADREAAAKIVRSQFRLGDMVIAYGRPTWVMDDGRVHLDFGFASAIAKEAVSTAKLKYGRLAR